MGYPVRAMRLLRAALLLAPLFVGCAPKPVAVEAPTLPAVPSIYVVEIWKGDVLPTEPRP